MGWGFAYLIYHVFINLYQELSPRALSHQDMVAVIVCEYYLDTHIYNCYLFGPVLPIENNRTIPNACSLGLWRQFLTSLDSC